MKWIILTLILNLNDKDVNYPETETLVVRTNSIIFTNVDTKTAKFRKGEHRYCEVELSKLITTEKIAVKGTCYELIDEVNKNLGE